MIEEEMIIMGGLGKRYLKLINISVAVLISFVLIFSNNIPVRAQTTAAAGTTNDPILIQTAEDINQITKTGLDKHYKLMNDVDAGNMAPIGSEQQPFTGYFDGNGYKVKLSMNYNSSDSKNNVGLFGYIGYNGTVINLKVSGTISITGENINAGAIAGTSDGLIRCCGTSAAITVSTNSESNIGGLAGYVTGLSVTQKGSRGICDSYSAATINISANADTYTGGLAGYSCGTIDNCYFAGSLTAAVHNGTAYAGGLVGNFYFGQLSNSHIYNDSPLTINGSCSYRMNPIGKMYGTYNGLDYFYDETLSGLSDTLNANMESHDFYWQTESGINNGFPILFQSYAGGNGTSDNPYRIETKEQLARVYYSPGSAFLLMDDIDGGNIEPIGSKSNPFSGTFNGNGHTITINITKNLNSETYVGLFGYVTGSVLNLNAAGTVTVNSGNNHTDAYVGGMTGCNCGNFNNCRSTVNINYISDYTDTPIFHVGGFAGTNMNEIKKCSAAGNIIGKINEDYSCGSTDSVGGFVGEVQEQTHIDGCFSEGDVTVTDNIVNPTSYTYIGGFVGHSPDDSHHGIITNSYSTGNVSGALPEFDYSNFYCGGFSGEGNLPVVFCYATGDVDGQGGVWTGSFTGAGGGAVYCYTTGHVTGGLCIDMFFGKDEITTSSCYYNSDNAGDRSSRYAKGLTTAQMTGKAVVDNMKNFDFSGVWQATENTSDNRYYPQLKVFLPSLDSVAVPAQNLGGKASSQTSSASSSSSQNNTNSKPSSVTSPKNPDTGDDFPVSLITIVAFGLASVMIFVKRLRRV